VTLLTRMVSATALFLVAGCSQPSAEAPPLAGDWSVDGSRSLVSFATVKAGDIGEAHEFTGVSGSVAADGTAELDIDLATVSTGIDVRDQRMRDILFDVAANPVAVATVKLDPAAFSGLGVGDSVTLPVTATLSLHGVEGEVEAELEVTRIAPGAVQVVTTKPIIVDAASFALTDGVEQLRELAGLPSITPVVPVNLSLVFKQ
jgi:polyisoprenoid-binding protein YceI